MYGPEKDNWTDYVAAQTGLQTDPDNRDLQHQLVLALARAGALDMADAEYERLGLDAITDHEDIMALAGRLLKDRSIAATEMADKHVFARRSAAAYQRAFDHTQGYYSAINAATMACLANLNADQITAKAQRVLDLLPNEDKVLHAERYFLEATRAEAYLLLGDQERAELALIGAWMHDPLNYVAQASTLRQFRLICAARDTGTAWLKRFEPPTSIHFAGPIFTSQHTASQTPPVMQPNESQIRATISDCLQHNDVGYAFGSLSAGSDIILAEAVLTEGGKLHILLPLPIDRFRTLSVTPYGTAWDNRYDYCLEQAESISILSPQSTYISRSLNRFTGQVCMGRALLQARHFSAGTLQLLMNDTTDRKSFTSDHRADWAGPVRHSLDLRFPELRAYRPELTAVEARSETQLLTYLADRNSGDIDPFDHPAVAIEHARKRQADRGYTSNYGISCGVTEDASYLRKQATLIAAEAVPGSITLSEIAACILEWDRPNQYRTMYSGCLSANPTGLNSVFSVI